jgi:hypothetical protein
LSTTSRVDKPGVYDGIVDAFIGEIQPATCIKGKGGAVDPRVDLRRAIDQLGAGIDLQRGT